MVRGANITCQIIIYSHLLLRIKDVVPELWRPPHISMTEWLPVKISPLIQTVISQYGGLLRLGTEGHPLIFRVNHIHSLPCPNLVSANSSRLHSCATSVICLVGNEPGSSDSENLEMFLNLVFRIPLVAHAERSLAQPVRCSLLSNSHLPPNAPAPNKMEMDKSNSHMYISKRHISRVAHWRDVFGMLAPDNHVRCILPPPLHLSEMSV